MRCYDARARAYQRHTSSELCVAPAQTGARAGTDRHSRGRMVSALAESELPGPHTYMWHPRILPRHPCLHSAPETAWVAKVRMVPPQNEWHEACDVPRRDPLEAP